MGGATALSSELCHSRGSLRHGSRRPRQRRSQEAAAARAGPRPHPARSGV